MAMTANYMSIIVSIVGVLITKWSCNNCAKIDTSTVIVHHSGSEFCVNDVIRTTVQMLNEDARIGGERRVSYTVMLHMHRVNPY